jgi:diguanylate cyclase (GGDEF)-like protein
VHGTEPIVLVTQTFFLVSTNAIGMLACYSMERVLRRAYLDQRTIAELAQLDPLTGLHNRRAFFSLGETEISRCAHERLPVSAAMVDIDYFKQINDQHGHTTGDRVLQMFGETLRAALRSGDVVCRYGGEEFLILMPATGEVEAERVAQRLHASLARLVVSAPGGPIRPTASIGVATLAAARADRLEQLISAADAALYAAKRAGRNRIMAA